MLAFMKKVFLFVARIFFSLIFVIAGTSKVTHWQEAVNRLSLTFSKWYIHLEEVVMTMEIHEFLLARASIILGIATFFEVVGALMVLIGFRVRVGALLLLLFLVPTTLIMHPFWFGVGEEMQSELSVFLKNLSLIGALLYLLIGPQPQRVKQ